MTIYEFLNKFYDDAKNHYWELLDGPNDLPFIITSEGLSPAEVANGEDTVDNNFSFHERSISACKELGINDFYAQRITIASRGGYVSISKGEMIIRQQILEICGLPRECWKFHLDAFAAL